ncbi:hypothetical protein [Cohnella fermenti]|nr:hypothetical protein [Cohnella fermenti]
MTEDVFAFGHVLGFLMHLLHAGHAATFLGLLHAVSRQHHAIMDGH